MAKRIKAEPATAAGSLPTAEHLKKVMTQYRAKMGQMATLRGEIGAMLKQAQHDFNINLPAFKRAAKQIEMDETKRADIRRHAVHYDQVFALDQQPDMFGDDPPAKTETTFGKAAGKAVKTAGKRRGAGKAAAANDDAEPAVKPFTPGLN